MGNAFGKSKAEDEEHLNPEPEVQQATPESPPPTTPKKALTPKKATTPTKSMGRVRFFVATFFL